ncbi:hypothetical protein EVAR_96039_1 [Eumeta japonica]|uniref:Uncharacterized protein n=1 Tax=Eumeta variegata TaxID=151549 RepID=A0A4C1WAC1_EUMVA|nr:hypothetical protein EVAR_96039_1 [Eumeta japonica]
MRVVQLPRPRGYSLIQLKFELGPQFVNYKNLLSDNERIFSGKSNRRGRAERRRRPGLIWRLDRAGVVKLKLKFVPAAANTSRDLIYSDSPGRRSTALRRGGCAVTTLDDVGELFSKFYFNFQFVIERQVAPEGWPGYIQSCLMIYRMEAIPISFMITF